MKSFEYTIDLKDTKSIEDVFAVFDKTFDLEGLGYQWRIVSWNALSDFLWGLIQPGVDESGPFFADDIEQVQVKVINSAHLTDSIRQLIQDVFDHVRENQSTRTKPEDSSIFRNSTFEIVN